MNDDTIKLYHSPHTRSERVKKLLEVFEIPHEVVLIDYEKEQQKSEDYLRDVHPLGRVPALGHRGQVILESGAICMYLADLFPEKGMAPELGTPERGRYYEWYFMLFTTLEPIVIAAGNPEHREKHASELRDALTQLAERIEGPHVLGASFTAVDVLLHAELFWYKMLGIYPAGIPKLDAYFDRLAERMAWPA